MTVTTTRKKTPAAPPTPTADDSKIVESFDAIDHTHSDVLDMVWSLIVTCQALSRVNEGEDAIFREDLENAFRGMKLVLATVREHANLIKMHVDAIYGLTVDGGAR
jgi:hypothetical protein